VKLNMSSKKPSPMYGNRKVGVIVCQTISYSTQILEFIQMNDLLIYRIEKYGYFSYFKEQTDNLWKYIRTGGASEMELWISSYSCQLY